MANIQPYINAINQAVLGEEVRGSITGALNAMNLELILGAGWGTFDRFSELPEIGTVALVKSDEVITQAQSDFDAETEYHLFVNPQIPLDVDFEVAIIQSEPTYDNGYITLTLNTTELLYPVFTIEAKITDGQNVAIKQWYYAENEIIVDDLTILKGWSSVDTVNGVITKNESISYTDLPNLNGTFVEANSLGGTYFSETPYNLNKAGLYAFNDSWERVDNDKSLWCEASGKAATANGFGTTASGEAATANGYYTMASGDIATANGYYTTASGYAATANGYGTTASGDAATANGSQTTASGNAATANGYYTMASGDIATANGYYTTASGEAATANGSQTTASGDAATANGSQTTASGDAATANGFGTTASGEAATANGSQTTASGDAATANGSQTTASGYAATANGYYTTASGDAATANGYGTMASGYAATANGSGTTASGDAATANGSDTTASGYAATANGSGTTASGDYATANGSGTTASGDAAASFGFYTNAKHDNSTIVGKFGETDTDTLFAVANGASIDNKSLALNIKPDEAVFTIPVLGITADAFDNSTKLATTAFVQGEISGIFGEGTTAIGENSSAFGYGNNATGDRCFAINMVNDAIGDNSFACGFGTQATGLTSFSCGILTRAKGKVSFAAGNSTTVIEDNSAGSIFGTFGETTEDTLFAVANGTSVDDKSLALNVGNDIAEFAVPVISPRRYEYYYQEVDKIKPYIMNLDTVLDNRLYNLPDNPKLGFCGEFELLIHVNSQLATISFNTAVWWEDGTPHVFDAGTHLIKGFYDPLGGVWALKAEKYALPPT